MAELQRGLEPIQGVCLARAVENAHYGGGRQHFQSHQLLRSEHQLERRNLYRTGDWEFRPNQYAVQSAEIFPVGFEVQLLGIKWAQASLCIAGEAWVVI